MSKNTCSPYVTGDGKLVSVRDIAGDIVEMVEDVLARYNIVVPDEDRDAYERDEASFYGMTYGLVEDAVSAMLTDVVKSINPNVLAEDGYNGTTGNYASYCDMNRLKFQYGEFTQMITISPLHVSEETAELLDRAAAGKALSGDAWCPPVYKKDSYGWFIFVDLDILSEMEDSCEVSADLKSVMEYAAKCGCTWLCLDGDAEPVPELQLYKKKGGQ